MRAKVPNSESQSPVMGGWRLENDRRRVLRNHVSTNPPR